MSVLLKPNWEKINSIIWNSDEILESAPPDMYIELLRYRLLGAGRAELDKPENIETLNDAEKAKERFGILPAPQNERECAAVLREYFKILRQFNGQTSKKYREKLEQWITDHNLRYKVDDNCEIRLTIQGSMVTQFEFLRNSLATSAHRADAINDIEKSLSNLDDTNEVRNCIRNASNLLEGIVIDKSSVHSNTLTGALPGCRGFFPHASLMECVEKIYKFCSDYPNIRHSGTASSSLRSLKKDDALLMVAVTIGFGTFVLDNDAGDKILSGDF